jgi:hypothetical protein
MSDDNVKKLSDEIIKKLITYSYSQIFDITPAERELTNLHIQSPNSVEPLIGMMFCSIMLGNRKNAFTLGNEIWNIGGEISDELEVLYTDCLINIGEFEKAKILTRVNPHALLLTVAVDKFYKKDQTNKLLTKIYDLYLLSCSLKNTKIIDKKQLLEAQYNFAWAQGVNIND